MKKNSLILTCEHASCDIPPKWQYLFTQHKMEEDVEHYDKHVKDLTMQLAKDLGCPHLLGECSKQFVDLKKSHHQDLCLGQALQPLSETEKQEILNEYYHSYQNKFKQLLAHELQKNRQVLHISIHSFHPVENGVEHQTALGLAYDSSRHAEKEVARIWHELLVKRSNYKVRLNYPRSGRGENFPGRLRKEFSESDYLGLELDCNDLLLADKNMAENLYNSLLESLVSLMEIL